MKTLSVPKRPKNTVKVTACAACMSVTLAQIGPKLLQELLHMQYVCQ